MFKQVLHLIVVKGGKTQCRINSACPVSYAMILFGFSTYVRVIITEQNKEKCELLQNSRIQVSLLT